MSGAGAAFGGAAAGGGDLSANPGAVEHEGQAEKGVVKGRAVAPFNKPHFATLNLNPTVEAQAKADPAGVLDHNRRNLAKAFKKNFGYVPDFLIVAGDEHRRLHQHIIIIMDDNELLRAREAFLAAGGTWSHKRGAGRQLDIQALPTPADVDTVANYLAKNMNQASAQLGDKKLYVSRPARAVAERLYEAERA